MVFQEGPPFPPLAKKALAIIDQAVAHSDGDGVSTERAHEVLVQAGFAPVEAEEYYELLHNRGRIYVVDGETRVTERILDEE